MENITREQVKAVLATKGLKAGDNYKAERKTADLIIKTRKGEKKMERYNVYRVVTYRIGTNGIDKLFDYHAAAVKQTPTSKWATDMGELGKAYSPFIWRDDICTPCRLKNVTKEEVCSHYDNAEFLDEDNGK